MLENEFDKELLSSSLLGVRTLKELYEKEKNITNVKMIMLNIEPIEGELDYRHLKEIHYFLFKEVYSWAGKDRYEANIGAKFGKGKTLFTPYEKLPMVSTLLFNALKDETYFKYQDKETFTKSASSFMNGLNILHPFREGNGRVQRIFMQYLATNAGYSLNFRNITYEEMRMASIKGANGNLVLMQRVFSKALEEGA